MFFIPADLHQSLAMTPLLRMSSSRSTGDILCYFNEYSERIARPIFTYNKCAQVAGANVDDLSGLLFDKKDV